MYSFQWFIYFSINQASVRVLFEIPTKLDNGMCINAHQKPFHMNNTVHITVLIPWCYSIHHLSNHEPNNGSDGTKEVHLPKSLEKKFVGFEFSAHATCIYLPRLSTCLGSPLVSFLQTLQVLSTQPSSTYSPSTVFSETNYLVSIQ